MFDLQLLECVRNSHWLCHRVLIVRLQRLLPLKRALTEVEHDVRDTHEAMEEVSSWKLPDPLVGFLIIVKERQAASHACKEL